MNSLRKKEGYLIIDHSASPGIPADAARALGWDPRLCGEGKIMEAATLTCSHCKGVWMLNPLRTRERAYCRKCDSYICDACGACAAMPDYNHTPFEKLIEAHHG